MCGLCGEVRFDGGPVEPEAIVSMRDQMAHRGPDASGLYVSPQAHAGLGFRRLKIVDLSALANQPMGNEDGTVQVVFNGEIYNFQGLREGLLARGHQFRSRSDTEVIVHLYEEYGDQCIEQLDGMFAIAIWDDRRRRLVLARDRAGKKPLFYHRHRGRIVFASEIKAFFGRPDLDIEIDREAIPYYFLYGYVPGPQTFYRGIRHVEPGTIVSIEGDGRVSERVYWRLQFPDEQTVAARHVRQDDAVATLRTLMTGAVERRLISDVPLGAFLSGGIDSTIVVGLMSQLLDQPVKTFSIGFKDSPGYDETAYARIAAERFKTDHTEFIVEPGAFDLIEKLVWHHDGPFGDSSAVPTAIVSALTRQHVTVVLTGDGSDEIFGGYSRFIGARIAEAVPAPLQVLIRGLSRALPPGQTARDWPARVHRFARSAALPIDERLAHLTSQFYDDVDEMLAPDFRRTVGPTDRLRYLAGFRDQLNGLSSLNRLLLTNFNTYLRGDLLVKTDRCTMAHSIEARSPFLDTAVIEYAAGLPDAMKIRRGRTKAILRDAFQDLIPSEIQQRGKMGFGVPFGLWFRGALRERISDVLLAGDARYQEFVSADYVHRLVARHLSGAADLGLPLWTLLCFEIWLRALPEWTRARPAPLTAGTPS